MEDVPALADFERAAAAYWRCVDDGDTDAASASTAQLERIVERWRLAGGAEDRLAHLLHDSSSGVRYAAAASLGREVWDAVERCVSWLNSQKDWSRRRLDSS